MNVNRRQLLKGSAATAGALALAGCSGSDNEPKKQDKGTLHEQAKNEGSLTLYTVTDQPAMEGTLNPAFTDIYPWAKVNTVALGPSEIASRMSSEYQAGQVQADVAWNTQGTMAPLIENDVLVAPGEESPVTEQVQLMNYDSATFSEHWFPGSTIPQVLMYNSDKISSSQAPDSWAELADSRWEGEIAIDRPSSLNVAGAVFATLFGEMSESEATSLMEGIAANSPTFTESASDTFRVLAQGEASIGIGLLNNVLAAQEEGSTPVRVKWLKPTTYLNVPVYIANDASNPAMARLYTEWLMSVNGQEAVAETGRVPTHGGVASYTFDAIPGDVQLRPQAYNTPSYFSEPEQWTERFQSIFG